MQKKMDYKAPDVRVIDFAIEEVICAYSKYSVKYPKGDVATHDGYSDPNDPWDTKPYKRYNGTTTDIWN